MRPPASASGGSRRGLEASSGRALWAQEEARFVGLPKVDARGIIYVRREDELVALDPRTGAVFSRRIPLGSSDWEFVFAGPGRVFVTRRAPTGTSLVVIE
jgi:outer membrane protein assembly factor BamB